MTALHTLQEYADALRGAGRLTESSVDGAAARTAIDCLSYDNRALFGTSLFL